MLSIPSDLATWNPADVTDWATGLDDDPTVTDAEYAQVQCAVTAALLDDDLAAEIHGPVTP